jgi:hypothetical protein
MVMNVMTNFGSKKDKFKGSIIGAVFAAGNVVRQPVRKCAGIRPSFLGKMPAGTVS